MRNLSFVIKKKKISRRFKIFYEFILLYLSFFMHPPSNKLVTSKLSVDMKTLLGKGSTGNVYQGVFLEPHPHPVAVKVIPLEEINN
jgi:hypothetical protein